MVAALTYLRNPWVWVGILVFFLLIGVAFTKMKPLIAINRPNPLPDVPNTSLAERQAIRAMANRLHTDMDGPTFGFMRDAEAWRQYMSMSDAMFIAVYNDFNSLYFRDGKGTLTQWLKDEVVWWDLTGVAGKNQVLARLASLNLQ